MWHLPFYFSLFPWYGDTPSQLRDLLYPQQRLKNWTTKIHCIYEIDLGKGNNLKRQNPQFPWPGSASSISLSFFWHPLAQYMWTSRVSSIVIVLYVIVFMSFVGNKIATTVETLYSTIYYSKYFIELNNDKSTKYVALWTHKRHPIPRPFGRAMECLLWVLQQKLIVL